MALIVEDGTGSNPLANSYADLDYIRAYALARGVVLDASDTIVDAQAIQGMDYIESFRGEFQGLKTYENAQPLQWPRTPVEIDCFPVDDDFMPTQLADMESQLVMEIESGVCLVPTQVGAFITKEKVDVLEVSYSDRIRTSGQPQIDSVDAYLDALTSPCGPGAPLTTLRI